jgi:hypothetical protein
VLTASDTQGFDEFMNLVVDDAVEVKMATKDTEESRRDLGMLCCTTLDVRCIDLRPRTNTAQGRQCCADTELVRSPLCRDYGQ